MRSGELRPTTTTMGAFDASNQLPPCRGRKPGLEPRAALRYALRRHRPRVDLADLSPAWFGMVMATGIIAIAASQLSLPILANGLLTLNIGTYALLWLLYLWRFVRHPSRFASDFTDPVRGPGFFTAVAASGVLGSEVLVLTGNEFAAWLLWLVTILLWLTLTYGILTAFTIRGNKPTLEHGIHGGWLLVVVATQSIAVLSALLAARPSATYRPELDFLALSMWLCGGTLYIWTTTLIVYRWLFFPVSPADLSPPYWINMGAMAISTLAGALLSINAIEAPFLQSLRPFINGLTLFYWTTGTWWIPMLVVLTLWRHVRKRFPLRYDPLYWGAVFPLGMYAAGTFEMARAMALDFLAWVPGVFFGAALLAWSTASVGVLRSLAARLFGTRPVRS